MHFLRRPTRQRKLPAHLADPNIVQFEDEAKVPEEPKKVTPEESQTGDETTEDEEEEQYDEEDPNKCVAFGFFLILCCKCIDYLYVVI